MYTTTTTTTTTKKKTSPAFRSPARPPYHPVGCIAVGLAGARPELGSIELSRGFLGVGLFLWVLSFAVWYAEAAAKADQSPAERSYYFLMMAPPAFAYVVLISLGGKTPGAAQGLVTGGGVVANTDQTSLDLAEMMLFLTGFFVLLCVRLVPHFRFNFQINV